MVIEPRIGLQRKDPERRIYEVSSYKFREPFRLTVGRANSKPNHNTESEVTQKPYPTQLSPRTAGRRALQVPLILYLTEYSLDATIPIVFPRALEHDIRSPPRPQTSKRADVFQEQSPPCLEATYVPIVALQAPEELQEV